MSTYRVFTTPLIEEGPNAAMPEERRTEKAWIQMIQKYDSGGILTDRFITFGYGPKSIAIRAGMRHDSADSILQQYINNCYGYPATLLLRDPLISGDKKIEQIDSCPNQEGCLSCQ